MVNRVNDNGGRRSGIECRAIEYFLHIPEQRSGKDRRSGVDRRQTDNSLPPSRERRECFK